MSIATVIARARRRSPSFPAILSAAAVLALSTAGLAGEDAGRPVTRFGASELRFAGGYEAGKVPVVFVHGLLGSPGNWSATIDELSADPTIRAQFQLLTFRYDSLRSIPESGLELVEALDEARRRSDPEGRDRAFDRVVVVGHSMGGLVAKAALRAGDHRPSGAVAPRAAALGRTDTPRVGRVIFIATPHRGARVDRGTARSVGSWWARALSPGFAPPVASGTRLPAGAVTSVDQLTWDHPLLADLDRASAAAGIPFHSIIAALGDPAAEGATDGLVPVASARLGNARSELIVRTHHFCGQHPDVIREVRRILIEDATPSALMVRDDSLKQSPRPAPPAVSSR
jgi:pimeloyl-ACP methyl ester carboxylesterase